MASEANQNNNNIAQDKPSQNQSASAAPEEGEETTEPTTGQNVSDFLGDRSQDYQDLDTVSGGKLSEGVSQGVDQLKDRYFPGKKQDGDTDGSSEPQEGTGSEKNPQNTQKQQASSDGLQPNHHNPDQPLNGNANAANQAQGAANAGSSVADAAETGGQAANTAGNLAKAGETGAQVAGGAAKAAQLGVEAAEIGAEAGTLAAEAGAGAATGGIAAGVIEGGKAAIKAAKKARDLFEKGLQIKERIDAGGRLLKKYWWCAGIMLIPAIIIGGVIYYFYHFFHLDTLSKAGQAIISIFRRNSSAGTLNFTNPLSIKAIENGDISHSVADLFTNISSGQRVTFNFVGDSPVTGDQNQLYEFDAITYGAIKCRLGTDKLPQIDVNLDPNFNWSAAIPPGKEDALCAVNYYPGLDSPESNDYSSVGPSEFFLKQIATAGPKASAQQSAALIDQIAQKNSASVNKPDNESYLPLRRLTLSSEIYNIISTQVIDSLLKAYPDKLPSEIIKTVPSAGGIHFEFD